MEHIGYLNIGSSVKRAFQRPDACGNGRVCICTGRRSYPDSKRRVVTSSVLCLKHQQKVECTRIQLGIIAFQHIEKVFGNRQILLRMTNV